MDNTHDCQNSDVDITNAYNKKGENGLIKHKKY